MGSVRIYEIPRCAMAASGCALFGEGPPERFSARFSARPAAMFPRDLLWYDAERGGFVRYCMLSEGESAPAGFGPVGFIGGVHAVATGPDKQPYDDVHAAIDAFSAAHPGPERDGARRAGQHSRLALRLRRAGLPSDGLLRARARRPVARMKLKKLAAPSAGSSDGAACFWSASRAAKRRML